MPLATELSTREELLAVKLPLAFASGPGAARAHAVLDAFQDLTVELKAELGDDFGKVEGALARAELQALNGFLRK